jgi:hypothetical protein
MKESMQTILLGMRGPLPEEVHGAVLYNNGTVIFTNQHGNRMAVPFKSSPNSGDTGVVISTLQVDERFRNMVDNVLYRGWEVYDHNVMNHPNEHYDTMSTNYLAQRMVTLNEFNPRVVIYKPVPTLGRVPTGGYE